MSQVTVTINGRNFRLACEDGEEQHLSRLAGDLDRRIEELRKRFGEIGDTRLTIMAALTIADELMDTAGKARRLEDEINALKHARVNAADRSKTSDAAVAATLYSAAERIEAITKRLNASLGDGDVAMGG